MGAMVAVFVHGVPETPAVWHGLLAARWTGPTRWRCRSPGSTALARPVSERRWRSTPTGSRRSLSAWTARSISSGTFGGALVVRVVSTRPSWSGPGSLTRLASATVEFEWHDFAKIWQTPQAGEDFWDQQLRHRDPGAGRCLPDARGARGRSPLIWPRTSAARWLIASWTSTVRPWTSGGSGNPFRGHPSPRIGDHP